LEKNKKNMILTINPGSTSTKIALFEEDNQILTETIVHSAEDIDRFPSINQQYDYRKNLITKTLRANGYRLENIDAFVARGGDMGSCAAGTYLVEECLLEFNSISRHMDHACELASHIATEFAKKHGGVAYMVNPPTVDEFMDVARICGFRDVWRRCRTHTLNQKEVAIRHAESTGNEYSELNLIVCHIGGGVTVTAHRKGRMIDSNAIMKGDGPMAPTRSGTIPAQELLEMAFSGKFTHQELWDRVSKTGGLMDHLGTADAREIRERIDNGDGYAHVVYDAMIYQIAKYVGSMAVSLEGNVDNILLTGGIAHDEYFVAEITRQIKWIAPIVVYAGEFEMEALAAGALRVMNGQEQPILFDGKPVWDETKFRDSVRRNSYDQAICSYES